MKSALVSVIALAAALAGPAGAAYWGEPYAVHYAQAKGRDAQERGSRGRDAREDRRGDRDERRDRLNEDERRALHRDLDKASRELYRPRERR